MKRIMILFFIVNILSFSVVKGNTDNLIIAQNQQEITAEKIDELNARIEALEKEIKYRPVSAPDNGGYVYNLDQIYNNSLRYYESTIENMKWYFGIIGAIFLAVFGLFKWDSDKKLKDEKKDIKDNNKEIKKENKDLRDKIEEKTSELKKKFNEQIQEYEVKMEKLKIEFDNKVKKVEFNSDLGIAINKNSDKERVEELKYIEMKEFTLSNINKGRLYFYLGYYTRGKEAISYYSKVIDLEPKDKYSYFYRALTYHDLKLYGKAKSDYNKVIDIDPFFEDAHNNIGLVEINLKDYNNAILEFNKEIDIYPDSAIAYSNRGLANIYLKNIPQAILDFNKAIDLDPKLALAYANKGYVLALSGDYNKGLELLEKSIEIDKDIEFEVIIAEQDYNKFIEFLENKTDKTSFGKEIYRRLKNQEGIEVI